MCHDRAKKVIKWWIISLIVWNRDGNEEQSGQMGEAWGHIWMYNENTCLYFVKIIYYDKIMKEDVEQYLSSKSYHFW